MKKIIFCGFGKLGRTCLELLYQKGYAIRLVLTHKELDQESVDTYAIEKNIDYAYLDARKNMQEIKEKINSDPIDYLISVNYRYIIPRDLFEIPRYAMNIHGSLLPKYRGRTPHVWSIINGEDYAGVTAHIIEETVDTGDIIEQIAIPIDPNDTGYSLLKKYEQVYPDLLIRSLRKLDNNEPLTKQNEAEASFFGKRTPIMGYIDFYKTAKEVINFVRAQAFPYPGAYYYLKDGRKITINRLEVGNFDSNPIPNLPIGIIHNVNNEYVVKCKDHLLKIVDYHID